MAVLTRTVTDAAGLRDTRDGFGRRWGAVFGGVQALSITKVTLDPVAWSRSTTDEVTLRDPLARALSRTFADPAGVVERTVAKVNQTIRLTATESIGASDGPAPAAGRARASVDAMPVADTTRQTLSFERVTDDGTGLVDALTRVGTVLLVDAVGLSEAAGTERLLLRSVTDRAGLEDSGYVGSGSMRRLVDGVGLSDELRVREVVLDAPGVAVLVLSPAATATLVAAPAAAAVVVLAEFGVGSAVVVSEQGAATAAVRQDVSSGGTATIVTRRS